MSFVSTYSRYIVIIAPKCTKS